MPQASPPCTVRFGIFEFSPDSGELRKNGYRLKLSGQPIQVLELLVENPGRLITRDELQQKIWSAASFGDFEHGLNAAVNRLREALGDSATEPVYIETVPRRGYRFIANLQADLAHDPPPPERKISLEHRPSNVRTSRSFILTVLLGTLLAVLLGFSYERFERKAQHEILPARELVVVPFTTLQGREIAPALSPDGSHIAFAWSKSHEDRFDLYLKVIGAESMIRLTHKPAKWLVPAWAPDDSTIAFVRLSDVEGESGIFAVPAVGGPEKKLADAAFDYVETMSLDWSPDGNQLAYADSTGMYLLSLSSGLSQRIPAPPECLAGYSPVISPNGEWLAFDCLIRSVAFAVYAMPMNGKPRRLTTRLGVPQPLAWSADSRRILFTRGSLWEIDREGGDPRRLLFESNAARPTVAANGKKLAYSRGATNVNIWALDLASAKSPAKIVSSTARQRSPNVSPDGKRIVFESDRSDWEALEIWVSDVDGSNPVQLTNFHSVTGTPKWSPDGRWIAFDSQESGEAAIYKLDTKGGVPTKLPINVRNASVPSWSRDGKWIYFSSDDREKGVGVYKVGSQGGDPIVITRTPGMNVQEAADGSLYFVSKDCEGELRVIPGVGGEERRVENVPLIAYPTDWLLQKSGIFFIDRKSQPNRIAFFDFGTARVRGVRDLKNNPEVWGGLAITPDGRRLLYSQVDADERDIMLVEDFR